MKYAMQCISGIYIFLNKQNGKPSFFLVKILSLLLSHVQEVGGSVQCVQCFAISLSWLVRESFFVADSDQILVTILLNGKIV